MNKKQIIQIVIVVAALSAAGIVLYNGFHKNSEQPALMAALPGSSQTSGSQQIKSILPGGTTLDFSVLTKRNLNYHQATYPKLDPSSEIGILENNLVVVPQTP